MTRRQIALVAFVPALIVAGFLGARASLGPWLVLAAGLVVVAASACALGLHAARRARAQRLLDRIFTVSPDLMTVAGFDGRLSRVNPAVEQILGYTPEEFLAQPYMDLVHPDDRARTAAEADAISRGKTALTFTNRYVGKDGAFRTLEWTAAPVVEDGVMYGVARDLTARRKAETDLRRLAGEQAALRRVAMLVAGGVGPDGVFDAVAEEAGALLGCEVAAVVRFDADGKVTMMGSHNTWRPSGVRIDPDPAYLIAAVRETGRAARFDTDDPRADGMPEAVRAEGIRSALASPIVVDGELWGAVSVGSSGPESLRQDAEARLGQFTELTALAIADAAARTQVERLAEEQAALQRVATLVAEAAPSAVVLDAVAAEMQSLLGAAQVALNRFEPGDEILVLAHRGLDVSRTPVGSRVSTAGQSATATVRRTGRPARMQDYTDAEGPLADLARATGLRSSVSAPVVVKGRLWGLITASWKSAERPPGDAADRMTRFSELVGTAVANTEAWTEVEDLAREQGALRRVATLVAEEVPLPALFDKVAEEVAELLGDADCSLFRDEGDGTAVIVAQAGAALTAGIEVGTRLPTDGTGVIATVLRERRPYRVEDTAGATGTIATRGGEMGIRSAVGCPIVVRGRLWGAMGAARYEPHAFPPAMELRIARFAELVATAVGNTEARAQVQRLADEQAALGRVATLVAQGVQPAELFAAVSQEVGRLFRSDMAAVSRFETGAPATVVVGLAQTLGGVTLGSRWELADGMSTTEVHRTGRSARTDHSWATTDAPIAVAARDLNVAASVSSPIVVEGHLWGAMTVAAKDGLPASTEARLEKFTDLVAIAIANVESREALRELADEQAALRRVATLVARGASPDEVFDAVASEMAALSQADGGLTMCRYEEPGEVTIIAHRGPHERELPPGTRIRHDDPRSITATVRRTGLSARQDAYPDLEGKIGDAIESLRYRSGVGVPIVVDGRVWGVWVASWTHEQPPARTERRMAQFGELLESAIANADSRDQLTASRARLVTEADAARGRVVRDLHDGAQQRLVHAIVSIKLAARALRRGEEDADQLIAEALHHAEQSNGELRELAHGILPSVLTNDGLRAGVDAVVERLDLPVRVDIPAGRFPAEIEASAYFIVAEALTNVVKHSGADAAEVTASVDDGMLRVEIRDDGIGGADPDGHGLVGIRDRVTALGGGLGIDSPPGGPTALTATLAIRAT